MKFLKNKKIIKENDFFLLLPNLMEIVSWKPKFQINFNDILFVEDQKKSYLKTLENFHKIIIHITVFYGVPEEWVSHL